jgi:hypothetical protein
VDKIIDITIALSAAFFAPFAIAQEKASELDRYLDDANTILVVKCLSVGPVNILLRANVEVEILHVVKGQETLRTILVLSQFGMTEGNRYLITTKNEAETDRNYFKVDDIVSVIPISHGENIAELKTLSPRIVILRTMNLRIYQLENDIRWMNYELDALKKVKNGD